MYTPTEVEEIQDCIDEMEAGPKNMTPERLEAIRDVLLYRSAGENFEFAAPLAVDKPELYQRVLNDPQVARYSYSGLLPATLRLAYDNADLAVVTQMVGTRSRVFRFQHPEGDFIIKSYQGEDERIIAPLVGESGFGPQQFPSLRNVMTEEFVPGQPLLDIQPGKPRKYYHDLGRRLGQFYRALHERNIFYNDGLINYEFGKSHVILGEEPEQAKVIDFGLSLNVSDPSAFTDEQVFNFARTLPGNSFLLGLRVMEPRGLVDQERDRVKSLTSPDIIKRDLEMLGESMDTLKKNQGRDFVRFIWQGFEKAYEI